MFNRCVCGSIVRSSHAKTDPLNPLQQRVLLFQLASAGLQPTSEYARSAGVVLVLYNLLQS